MLRMPRTHARGAIRARRARPYPRAPSRRLMCPTPRTALHSRHARHATRALSRLQALWRHWPQSNLKKRKCTIDMPAAKFRPAAQKAVQRPIALPARPPRRLIFDTAKDPIPLDSEEVAGPFGFAFDPPRHAGPRPPRLRMSIPQRFWISRPQPLRQSWVSPWPRCRRSP